MSRRWVALTLAGVLAVAVGGFAVWTVSCRAGSPVQALPADVSGGIAYPKHTDEAAERDSVVARKLNDIGLDVEPRWGLWESYPEVHDGETLDRWPRVFAVAAADDVVVTVQSFSGSGWCRPEERVLAAYDARTGASRWVTRWQGETRPLTGDPSFLPGVPGQVLLFDAAAGGGLSAIDVDTGATTWHIDFDDRDATNSVVTGGGEWIVVSSQHRSDSTLRVLNPSTGGELWRVVYEAHDAALAPALAGDVVVVFAVPGDGGASELQAYDSATGELMWTATPAAPPYRLAGSAAVAVANSGAGEDDPLEAFNPRTGERIWTASLGGSSPEALRVVGEGVLVDAYRSSEQPEDLLLLDPATGTIRWTASGLGMSSGYRAAPFVLDDPARLLLDRREQLATIDVTTGRVVTTDSGGEGVLATSPAGDVVVAYSGLRVSVLTTGS